MQITLHFSPSFSLANHPRRPRAARLHSRRLRCCHDNAGQHNLTLEDGGSGGSGTEEEYEQFEQISLHFDVNAQMIDIGKAYEKSVWIPSPET
jgi:hypothetical protein